MEEMKDIKFGSLDFDLKNMEEKVLSIVNTGKIIGNDEEKYLERLKR
jgi:hypothetical protein